MMEIDIGEKKSLQISELRAYSWQHLNHFADLSKFTSSSGPTNTPDDLKQRNALFSPAKLLHKRPISMDYGKSPSWSGFRATKDFPSTYYKAWFMVELETAVQVEALVMTGFRN